MNRQDLHYLWLTYPDGNNYYLPKAVHVWAVNTFNALAAEQDYARLQQLMAQLAAAQQELQGQGLNGFTGLNGLFDIFKSKSRKTTETELPKLQAKLQEQTRLINSQTKQISELQGVIQQNRQVNAQLNNDIQTLNNRLNAGAGDKKGINPVFLAIPGGIALISIALNVRQQQQIKKLKAA